MPSGVFSAAASKAGFFQPPSRQGVKSKRDAVASSDAPSGSQASQLAFAARQGDLKEVKRLLKKKSDPNACDAVGETPLFEAAASGNVSVVATLLLAGADPEHESLIGSVALDLSTSKATTALLRLSCGQEVKHSEREVVLEALEPSLRPPIRSFMQSLTGEDSDEDDLDIDGPPKLVAKTLPEDDEDGDDWAFAAKMVDQARKSRARHKYQRPLPVSEIELRVSHALNDSQLILKLKTNNTFADAKKAIQERLRASGEGEKKIYLVKKERAAYQAYKDTDVIGHVREVRLVGANLPNEGE
eukprot:TRINITY_DN5715_c0_g1_i1.p1 TRINITY_DN5715_c0_g1~~TRINITY_DN5715_c0_g1_i1.p1  ORF type:complete len:310 (+),score=67.20 TRINITY_DN5715_c0_g1_i1:28-930(+)